MESVEEKFELMKRLVEVLFCDAEEMDIEELKRLIEYVEGPLSEKEQRKIQALRNKIMKLIREETTYKTANPTTNKRKEE